MLALVFMLVALILFVLAAFDVHPKAMALGWAFMALAFVVQMWPNK